MFTDAEISWMSVWVGGWVTGFCPSDISELRRPKRTSNMAQRYRAGFKWGGANWAVAQGLHN